MAVASDYQMLGVRTSWTESITLDGAPAGGSSGLVNLGLSGGSGADASGWHMFSRPDWWSLASAGVIVVNLDGSPGGFPYAEQTDTGSGILVRSVTGSLQRRGHRVPLKLQWEEVIRGLDLVEISRSEVEAVIPASATTVEFSLSAAALDTRVEIANFSIHTPILESYYV